ncbi:DUF4331 domain-containing protein [Gloeobacter kilaueensis]|uniref:DUF4331 domain-containing protein n=1 Tax=Gloeobacter kilaueensis (strain ATCC BAA-2537 / CCAP 1431/1 / ULC 316 / JS1) TaxID=1183438 RepID=U5QDC1_GLOK1|nr:DUF4331 domain-containing protein [Gloeobacter kilaueensis]AGY56828.1 hypothetical protein GKIL_0582 [Gloeobacter kilaueensis JS1]
MDIWTSKRRLVVGFLVLGGVGVGLAAAQVNASSHREAPFITTQPKLDGTDFYLFNSYETGRSGFVTLIANYLPLQDPYGGPNYFQLDPQATYSIHIDNNGDAKADISFNFKFTNTNQNLSLPIGRRTVAVPFINVGPITTADQSALNVVETYKLNVVRSGISQPVRNAADGSTTFTKPADYIGTKSFPDYPSYAANYIYNINIPGCGTAGRLFVGQRKDPFVVNLGEVFDLVNVSNPLGATNAEADDLADKNITSLILEVPTSCLASASSPIIGGWTTSSNARGQQSRLANPLVNELVVGLKDKDTFNSSQPVQDAQFLPYVTHPTLPAVLQLLFGSAGVQAPTLLPRTDLVQVFLTGVPGLNRPPRVAPAELMRLNTSIAAVPASQQNNLGVIGGDNAGYPNGRRPGDDVVDISLRVAMGKLLPADKAPSGQLPFTDGAFVDASFFDQSFPYLKTPIPGSPNNTP